MKTKILIFIFIFLGLCTVFAIIGRIFENLSDNVFNLVNQNFSDLFSLNSQQLLGAIFLKNLMACSIVVFLSSFLFGLPIFIFIVLNTLAIGIVISIYPKFVIGLLPHGIFEIPAVCISLALAWNIWRRPEKIWRKIRIQDIIFFVKTVIPLLLVAAVVEVFITPAVINCFVF